MALINKIFGLFKRELMLSLALTAAVAALIINPPGPEIISSIDWHTLGTLFMMLTVLEGFKKESVLSPLVRLTTRFRSVRSLSLFLVFCVFFTSMFVTNDVSLIIFVPLTISQLRMAGKEKYILPVISLENIAAVRGSLLMPFGSPQNLFLFGRFNVSALTFMLHMAPLCIMSGILLVIFIFVLTAKEKENLVFVSGNQAPGGSKRWFYVALFCLVLWVIVSRTTLWMYAVAVVFLAVILFDPVVIRKTDYVLLATFLCFFVFSSSISSHPAVAGFLSKLVAGNEYWVSIGISQIISNVPASIVLYPFTVNNAGLIYGLDTAGLVSLIGSLASVINYRIYIREYPGRGKQFIKTFTLVSWAFFAIVVVPGYLLSSWPFV